MSYFAPETDLDADAVTPVREAVREDWKATFRRDGAPELNTEPETQAGQLIDSQTAALVDKDNEVLFLAQQFDPLTAQGVRQGAPGEDLFPHAQGGAALRGCVGV